MNLISILTITAIVSFLIALILTKLEIPYLRKKAGQNIREEGLSSHYSKAGTPSMGGISIVVATVLSSLGASLFMNMAWGIGYRYILVIMLAFIGFGLVGFLDDYLKVIKKQNEGLKVKPKFGLQLLICALFAILSFALLHQGGSVYFPGFDIWVDFGVMYVPFIVFAMLAMTNAVNLTDGLDGLASGVTSMVCAAFIVSAVIFTAGPGNSVECMPAMVFFAALCGACLGFLVFNRNPARVFMGDTGSLALGGGIAAAAVVMKLELLLLIIGLLYVIEALSVVMQVGYFKATHGKRIFKMAPIHHHFEMCGMKETQVVKMFWAFTALCCIAGVLIV